MNQQCCHNCGKPLWTLQVDMERKRIDEITKDNPTQRKELFQALFKRMGISRYCCKTVVMTGNSIFEKLHK